MRSAQFYPGEKVIVLNNDEMVNPGAVGTVISKWRDTIYAVKINGSYHWLDSSEVSSIDPARHSISAGDIIKITSEEHNHPFAKLDDRFKVVKIIEDMDYYRILVNGQLHYFSNFELAPYTKYSFLLGEGF